MMGLGRMMRHSLSIENPLRELITWTETVMTLNIWAGTKEDTTFLYTPFRRGLLRIEKWLDVGSRLRQSQEEGRNDKHATSSPYDKVCIS